MYNAQKNLALHKYFCHAADSWDVRWIFGVAGFLSPPPSSFGVDLARSFKERAFFSFDSHEQTTFGEALQVDV